MEGIVNGIIAGVVAGIIMAVISEAGFRLKLFASSLLLVDGSFLFNTLKVRPSTAMLYAAGIPIHLVTSAVFGGIYIILTWVLLLNTLAFVVILFYFLLLWLAMLFIALPIAGVGFLGKKVGRNTWLEQLVLHIFFAVGYYLVLRALL